jgi:type IV pilus assembly protein PilA
MECTPCYYKYFKFIKEEISMNKEIKNTITNEKGFTLVELIVVIAILAILAAVAVPNYVNYQYRSALNTDISTASEIVRAARIALIEDPSKSISKASDLDEFSGNELLASDKTATVDSLTITASGSDPIVVATSGLKAGSYSVSGDVTENEPLPSITK